jgi:predicted Zn-dependent peptidase
MLETKQYDRLGETLHTYVHPSGMKVYIVRKEGYQKKTAVFAASYGSIDNRFRKPGSVAETVVPDGIAHFLEHKLFEQQDMNVLEKFSRLGASPNAFTSFHETAYHFTCTDRFDENFRLLLDFVQHPWLTDENVEKEKGIIGQEIRMYDDNADWRVFFNLLTCLYREHPVRLDIAGTVESIAGITKDMLLDCYHTFYSPSNMALAVVGDVDPDAVAAMVNDRIEQQENRGRIGKVYPAEQPGVAREVREQQLVVSMPLFMMGVRDDAVSSGMALLRRRTALSVAMDALAGRSSDLYSRLYEEGLINESFGTDVMMVPAFGFVSWGGQSPDPDKVAAVMNESVARLVADGLDAESFARVRRAHEGQFIRSLNSLELLARELVDNGFADTCHFDLADVYATLTLDEVNLVVRDVLGKPGAISVIRPVPENAA